MVGIKLSLLKHNFTQEILITLLQHCVAFFNQILQLHFAPEAEPRVFLACSSLGKFEPRCSYKIFLVKKTCM